MECELRALVALNFFQLDQNWSGPGLGLLYVRTFMVPTQILNSPAATNWCIQYTAFVSNKKPKKAISMGAN